VRYAHGPSEIFVNGDYDASRAISPEEMVLNRGATSSRPSMPKAASTIEAMFRTDRTAQAHHRSRARGADRSRRHDVRLRGSARPGAAAGRGGSAYPVRNELIPAGGTTNTNWTALPAADER
jgi:hypothetical protein